MNYATHFATRTTPQSQPIPGAGQVPNSAGGHAWQVDCWTLLDRFLVLGTEGGSYYASEKAMTYKAGEGLLACIAEDGLRTVNRIVEISDGGRAPKNDPALFALAVCAGAAEVKTRQAALAALPKVARIGTHLFTFCEAVEQFRGHGRALNRALAAWYTAKDSDTLAYQLVKYQQRGGWAHRDVLRLCKPKPTSEEQKNLFAWVCKPERYYPTTGPEILRVAGHIRGTASAERVVEMLREFPSYPWEAIPTEHLGKEVWQALLPGLPLTATIRNLGRMTANGALGPANYAQATEKLTGEAIHKARVHPIAILTALLTYRNGHGLRGNLTWQPVPQIIDALDEAFYAAFDNVTPTGKRWVIGLDVSGSMDSGMVAGVDGLTPRVASSALCMVTARAEQQYHIMAFSQGCVPLAISPRQRLDDICEATNRLPFMGTDCALPMLWALENGVEADVFAVYTDSETWAGQIHPSQALRQYREKTGIPAKLIVVGMTAEEFSIADPRDPGMMDVVGFSAAVPDLMAQFVT